MFRKFLVSVALAAAVAVAAAIATSGTSAASQASRAVNGGVLRAGIADNPDHIDTGIGFAVEGWELTEATGNGLVKFKDAPGPGSSQIVPDLALAMPKITNGGKTYTFRMHSAVRFSPPVNRAARPSDIKYAIERLYHVNSPGVGFYTDIVGASKFAKKLKGGISGIVANDRRMTITFHLMHPDGAFLDILAMPFAFAVPKGMPYKDISTDAKWRVGTGPYVVSRYIPHQRIVLTRNPNFHQWTPNSPRGHLNEIDIQIGVTPEQAVNETINGQLDWYMGAVPTDRLSQLKAQYPKQVHLFPRNNDTYFLLNERKYPFTKLAVRQAVNYATKKPALVKIFGGQGQVSETVIPPGFGSAYKEHTVYPYNLAKAKTLIKSSGAKGAKVQIWAPNTDPAPKAAQYEASVLNSIGLHVTGVKLLDESVYYDELLSQKTDPQMALTQFDQDYPEGEDFIDTMLNGENITQVGNNNTSNTNDPVLNKLIDKAKLLPLGKKRNAAWAHIDKLFMVRDAGWVPFMHRLEPKFVSPRLHGLVFTGSYFELLPRMWLSK
ncbi:MAG TPA: ABC transporter substrate-binding protein [Gaiellaceae bacterium]|nr:ABC transporter substrate-binding protein [Gaiellaceae bacterium]